MKAKYEKMIDEYVKKHYGDLERGVLAPEVKYKVLFKIYRKKLKEKKVQVRMLRRLLQGKKEIESWGSDSNSCSSCVYYIPMHAESRGLTQDAFVVPASCSLGKSMTACCPFYSVKVDEKKAQKEMSDLHEVCGNCIHFREGKGEDKSTCAKHDKFVTETCSCYEFEDKESSYLDWLHDDITWCCRECSNMDCERNSRNRRCKEGLYSVADMYDPFRCPVDAEIEEKKDDT
jgi:hypothetical protein